MGGTLEGILQYILMVVTIILALAVIELKNLLHAAIAFCGMSITIGGIFWILYAPYAAVFQVLIYAGAVVTIFLAAVMFTTRKESIK
jgi:NADH-quinone oxidoreductase subunit J